MCVPAPTSWPPASTTTAPTAGLGDTNPTPARANSSVRRMCCSSMVMQEPFHHGGTETRRKAVLQIARGKTAILVLLVGLGHGDCSGSIQWAALFGRTDSAECIFRLGLNFRLVPDDLFHTRDHPLQILLTWEPFFHHLFSLRVSMRPTLNGSLPLQ